MILLAASSKDVAGLNIAEQVLNHYPFTKTCETFQEKPTYLSEIHGKKVELVTLNEEAINAQKLPESFNHIDLLVFLSRHSSQSGTPTLSVHTPGNFGNAELGGLPRTLSVSPATAMRDALKALVHYKEKMRLNYEVSYECTHHGPSLNVPTMFVELGSSQKQWLDSQAAEAVAHAAMSAISKFGTPANPVAIGVGGTHYNQRFTRMALNGEAVFGHMIPKYAAHLADSEILRQCVEKTLEKVEFAILDWKGIKSESKKQVLTALQEIGLPFKKI